MRRATHTVFRDDYNNFDKNAYTIGCSAWGGGVNIFGKSTIPT